MDCFDDYCKVEISKPYAQKVDRKGPIRFWTFLLYDDLQLLIHSLRNCTNFAHINTIQLYGVFAMKLDFKFFFSHCTLYKTQLQKIFDCYFACPIIG